MAAALSLAKQPGEAQASWGADAEAIHRWYRIIMGFDWKLADEIIDKLAISPGHTVLDPFCGAGTTLVQCQKRGIDAVGLDANPVCTLATSVKTTWTLSPTRLSKLLSVIVAAANDSENRATLTSSPALSYLQQSGMIERGWLSLHKAKIVLSLHAAVRNTPMPGDYRRFFYLALVSAVVSRIADVKFGPEVYVLPEPRKLPAAASFIEVAEMMISDMQFARTIHRRAIRSEVILGDSRSEKLLSAAVPGGADFVITSPPYPNEHDYTRSTRLELVVLGHVGALAELRQIKRRMVRCSTKGIYKDDDDSAYAIDNPSVDDVARELDRRAVRYTDGFSKLYGRMVREYFGGMDHHFQSIRQALKPGGRCAYVVRDSQALLGVYIDTPAILARIATSTRLGFEIEDIVEHKRIKGTTGKRVLSEKILLLRKPI